MSLTGRDAAIVQLVARFHQLTSAHVYNLLFATSSHTPADRALRRLTEAGYLARIERRAVGGSRGGSGQYVYQLGRRGFYALYEGRYQPRRAIDYHALAIADCHLAFKKFEQAGLLAVEGYSIDEECWVRIGRHDLRPDLLEDISHAGRRFKLWLEVDRATEFQKQVRTKLERYWQAYQDADEAAWPVFPAVLWVAVDDERAKELRWLIQQLPADARGLFQVTTLAGLGSLFAA